jgi:UDP-N-acetylmuramyl pentapeptide synthase
VKLGLLLEAVPVVRFAGQEGQIIDSVHYDSRTVTPGGLFVAIQGNRSDGYTYIEEAIENGAVAVLAEKEWPGRPSISVAQVESPAGSGCGFVSILWGSMPRALHDRYYWNKR